MVTLQEANDLLAKRKALVRRPPEWKPKPNHRAQGFLEYQSAIEADGLVIQDAKLVAQWRSWDELLPERFCIGLYLRGERIFAWDVDPLQRHQNNKGGIGRPFYGQTISGHHVHTWSLDGYGYVEPLSLLSYALCDVWDGFLDVANIIGEPCVDPDEGRRTKGMYLDFQ